MIASVMIQVVQLPLSLLSAKQIQKHSICVNEIYYGKLLPLGVLDWDFMHIPYVHHAYVCVCFVIGS